MTDIVVLRGTGHRPGADIVDPILATTALALARGDAELDEGEASNSLTVTLPLIDIRLGESIRVQGPLVGLQDGKVTSLSHQVSVDADGNLSGETQLVLKVYRASG
jgi:hypothetical protein